MNTISLDYALESEPFTIGQDDGLVIPLPALFMRWFVPVIGKMRTWTRFGIIAVFALAVLAALGAAAWHRREIARRNNPPSKQRRAWMIVIGLALFELWWTPLAMHEPNLERPVDRWLADQSGQHPIIQYPLESAFTARQFLYARAHGKPIIHGYATYFSFVFSRQHPELLTFPNPKGLRQLADWDVQYVLIETAGAYAEESQTILEKINQESCLQLHPIQGSVYVVELVNCDRS